MHRNTFINSPQLLLPSLQLKAQPNVFFAGQITGTEGYVESAASGMLAGVNAARLAKGESTLIMPQETMLGALCGYITTVSKHFQPMNANFGIVPPTEKKIRNKKERYAYYAQRSLNALERFMQIEGCGCCSDEERLE